MSESKISGVIITFNEERNIQRCIESMHTVVDEVLVVDSYSSDKTEEICRSLGVRFLQNKFIGHIEQKNFAVEQAQNNFILSLDADECLSEKLKQSISEAKASGLKEAYNMNRLTSYCGKWIHHSGWYPDTKIRLWDRRMGSWQGENPHDKVVLKQGLKPTHVKGDILHYSFPTIASHVVTANTFSEIAADAAIRKGKKINILVHIIINPVWTFFNRYIIRFGFLDGIRGFVISVLSGYSNFLKYTKIWFKSRSNGKNSDQ